jgi:hypothetical protein
LRPPKYPWPSTPRARGTLLFAQLMAEMLNPASFESHRAFTLDSISRLDEAISLLYDVEQSRIPRRALDPVFAELLWSLEKDSVARTLASSEIEALKEIARDQQCRLSEISAHCFLIKKLISSRYKLDLERMLANGLPDNDHRLEFRKLCGFYCSYIVNIGYSKRYIESVVEEIFFKGEIRRTGIRTLNRFFNHFRVEQRKYIVHAVVSREFALFLKRLNYNVIFPKDLDEVTSESLEENIRSNPDHIIYRMEIDAWDQFGAMLRVHDFLTSVRAITYLSQQSMSCEWVNSMLVTAFRSNKGVLIDKAEISFDKPSSSGKKLTSGQRLKQMAVYAERLINNFDGSSSERLFSSLNIGALARIGASQENQLISFWSAIEVLLSDPPPEIPRIVHYASLLVPCVCIRHVRRQNVALFDELLVGYRRRFMNILNNEGHGKVGDGHTKLAFALLATENEALRNELCRLCVDNPLALHRLWKFNRDYKDPRHVLEAINGHEKRVEWQILRIYRARNHLVHSGKVPSYLESLILNAA